ncbi:outer membrane protein AprF [Pseudomonas graminis]|nr:outer membrane protein AprF [Pseudomonas graminis]
MFRYMKIWLAALLWISANMQAQAMGLFDVYEQALRNDPVFLGAMKERDAGLENRNIGRAGLLPQVAWNYNKGRNDSRATYKSDERPNSREDRHYNSFGSTLSVQQPIIDYEAYANYRKGVAQALFADQAFRGKSQELLVRVLSAYSQALFSRDQIEIAEAKKKAFERQFEQNRQMFDQGEGTRTDILEAESRYELAGAEEIEAQNEQDAALRELGALIGVPEVRIDELAPLRTPFNFLALTPTTYEAWNAIALSENADLASQRQLLEVAHQEVKRNVAGHLPKLNAYATVRSMESDSGNTYNQRYDTNTIGLEISLPLYAGGGVSASSRQASRSLEQAEYDLEGKTRETLIQLRRQFNACATGVRKIRAYDKALASAQALVVSTQYSIKGGERVNLDELNAQQQLYSTRQDLAKTRYEYLMAWIKLHYYAGTLTGEQLARVDEAFGPGRPSR